MPDIPSHYPYVLLDGESWLHKLTLVTHRRECLLDKRECNGSEESWGSGWLSVRSKRVGVGG